MIKYYSKEMNFDDEISQNLLLVDFYADWCGPCRMLGEVLEQLDNINILKVNCDEFSQLAQRYGIMTIPALLFFKNGELVNTVIGYKTKDELDTIINDI